MPGRYIVKNKHHWLDIGEQLSDQERRFALRPDGELDPRYALEAAIDLLSKPERQPRSVACRSRSFLDWLIPKRLTPLHGRA